MTLYDQGPYRTSNLSRKKNHSTKFEPRQAFLLFVICSFPGVPTALASINPEAGFQIAEIMLMIVFLSAVLPLSIFCISLLEFSLSHNVWPWEKEAWSKAKALRTESSYKDYEPGW